LKSRRIHREAGRQGGEKKILKDLSRWSPRLPVKFSGLFWVFQPVRGSRCLVFFADGSVGELK
jgi:hypothetical protein